MNLFEILNQFKRERSLAHEGGHDTSPIGEYLPEGEGTEIVLFDATNTSLTPTEADRLAFIRKELARERDRSDTI